MRRDLGLTSETRATVYGDFAADFVEERLANLCDLNGGIQTVGLPSFKEHIRAIAVGSTMPSLNTEILGNVKYHILKT
jgi:hypothetical protein